MNRTNIGWTDFTVNPIRYRAADGRVVWACEKLSPGCKNCYAEFLSTRYGGVRRAGEWNAATMATLTPFLDDNDLHQILQSKAINGKRIFLGDMTDIAGAWIPDALLDRLFAVLVLRHDATLQVLTKRADRLVAYLSSQATRERIANILGFAGHQEAARSVLGQMYNVDPAIQWPPQHIWIGFSAENQATFDERWPHMEKLAAGGWTTFCSAEPLLSSIDMRAAGVGRFCGCPQGSEPSPCDNWNEGRPCVNAPTPRLSWVIVGLESGSDRRDCGVDPLVSIVRQCEGAGVPVFVKQDCAAKPGQQGRIPDDIWKLKQFPEKRS